MKNSLRRIFALLMAVMMLAALGMSAAAEGENLSVVEFTKTLTKEENAYAPATEYTFTIAVGTADKDNAIEAGIEGGAAFVTGEDTTDNTLTITSTPDSTTGESDTNVDTGKTSLVYNEKIKIDISKFENPGIYRYTVTETAGTYAGITYDSKVRTLDVYIQENATTHEMEIAGAFMYYTTEGENADTKSTDFANDYDTADLTVSNTVTGNLGDTTKDFEFKFTITDVASAEESYYVEITDANGAKSYQTITSGAETTISLAHNESFKVYGLSAGDTYTITETAVDGYTTKVNDAATNTVTGSIAAAEEAADVADVTVAVNNHREATVPTGIAMTILPFVAMVAMAALVAVIFFQKKQRREA